MDYWLWPQHGGFCVLRLTTSWQQRNYLQFKNPQLYWWSLIIIIVNTLCCFNGSALTKPTISTTTSVHNRLLQKVLCIMRRLKSHNLHVFVTMYMIHSWDYTRQIPEDIVHTLTLKTEKILYPAKLKSSGSHSLQETDWQRNAQMRDTDEPTRLDLLLPVPTKVSRGLYT